MSQNILCPYCHHAVLDVFGSRTVCSLPQMSIPCLWRWIWVLNLLQIVLKQNVLPQSVDEIHEIKYEYFKTIKDSGELSKSTNLQSRFRGEGIMFRYVGF